MFKRKVFHFLKNPAVVTFELPDTVAVFLADFKYFVVEVLFDGSNLEHEITVLSSQFSYFHIGIPFLHLVLILHFKDFLLQGFIFLDAFLDLTLPAFNLVLKSIDFLLILLNL